MIAPLRDAYRWLRGHLTLTVLLAMLAVVGGTWGFLALLDEVLEGDTAHFDNWATLKLTRFHGEDYRTMEEIGRDITALGGITVLSLLTAAVVGYLLIARKRGGVALVLVATIGGLTLSLLLKGAVDRERPKLSDHLSNTITSSFPSGHAMMSAITYLTLGTLLARLVPGRVLKIYFIAVAMFLTLIVGVSRVYMGVHWPTDVLAGWTAGLVWAILCWLVTRYLQHRGKVEKDTETFPPMKLHR